ncbi:MAG: NAD(P)-binding protein [Haloarculaceae archaeon]
MRTQRELDDLSGHVIVRGNGIFGGTISNTLANAGHDVVAVERDEHSIDRIEIDAITPIQGDARTEGTLQNAGIERAAVVVAAIDNSNATIEVAILVSPLAPDVRAIVRVGNDRYSRLARRAGVDEVVIPEITSGQYVSQFISDEPPSD